VSSQLIYILGYDLLKEAVWDTWGRVSGFDYSTIWIIIIAMTYFDFVVGIGVGSKCLLTSFRSIETDSLLTFDCLSVVVACVSFVIVSSQRQPIRATMSGATAS
jgi:SulP family sulfate permease